MITRIGARRPLHIYIYIYNEVIHHSQPMFNISILCDASWDSEDTLTGLGFAIIADGICIILAGCCTAFASYFKSFM